MTIFKPPLPATEELIPIVQLALFEAGLGVRMLTRYEIMVFQEYDGLLLKCVGLVSITHDVRAARFHYPMSPDGTFREHLVNETTFELDNPNFFRRLFKFFDVTTSRIDLWYDRDHKTLASLWQTGPGIPEMLSGTSQ